MKKVILTGLVLVAGIGVAVADPKFEMSNPKDVELQKKIEKKMKADPRYRIKSTHRQKDKSITSAGSVTTTTLKPAGK